MSTTNYSIAQLRDALAFAKAHPDGTIRVAWAPWPGTYTGAAWHRWFQDCLMAKINRAQPACRGRKDTPEWFWPQWRASRALNTPRLIIDWLPLDLKVRFAHRLRANRDALSHRSL